MSTMLFEHMIQPENLQCAWARVQKSGKAPGLDGMTLEQFGWRSDTHLQRLRQDVLKGTYRPWPARRVRIPKSDGSERLIGVQAVRDRVLQRALLNLIQPRIEPVLEDCSYAFRPGRSIEHALAHIDDRHSTGFEWAARSDVTLCFDSIDRTLLDCRLAGVIPEKDVRALISAWLSAGYVEEDKWADAGVGVSQGDVLSPLLCNLYLDPFDEALTKAGHALVRYADDFVILGRTQAEAQRGLTEASKVLNGLKLRINPGKTQVVSFLQGFEYLGAAIVGSMRLPLHRVERAKGPPRFEFGYGHPQARHRMALPQGPPLASSRRALRENMIALLRGQHEGRFLPPMAAAFLEAWQSAGAIPSTPPDFHPPGWDSVYLI